MLDEALRMVKKVKINRTIAGPADTVTGILGEYVFAQYYLGDWKKNTVGDNKGKIDFDDIEIKTSTRPLSNNLNLLVRSDYKEKRKPRIYIQLLIDVPRDTEFIPIGCSCYIIGFAYGYEFNNAPKKDFGNKYNEPAGYECYFIPFDNLHSMDELKENELYDWF